MSQAQTVHVDIVSDVMCPWCYIGKRRLEKAITLLGDLVVEVCWRPFQLDETLPIEGKDRKSYLAEKFGGMANARSIYDAIKKAGDQEQISFAFEKINKSPNTLNCHRLIKWSKSTTKQDEVVEELFSLYFIEGGDLTSKETLINVARKVGMDAELVGELLATDRDLAETKNEIETARKMGINGVPCFIVDGQFAVSGAESPEILANTMKMAVEKKRGSK